MSEPDVFVDGSNRYLLWTDGDYTNCGGLKVGQLENFRKLYPDTIRSITINGIEALGDCDGSGPLTRPQLAGASLYRFGEASMPGPYTLVFAANPTSVPDECRTEYGGTGSAYHLIAYATATRPQGPYTYQGIIVCGSTTEISAQASIMQVEAYNGRSPWVIVYHDGPSMGNSDASYVEPRRKLHAECLFAGAGMIAGVMRRPVDTKYGFNDCVGDGAFAFSALRHLDAVPGEPNILSHATDISTTVSRYAVGTSERYKLFEVDDGVYVFQALSNKAYLCTVDPQTAIGPWCSSATSSQARFELDHQADGSFTMRSLKTGLYVRVGSDGRLRADGRSGDGDRFTELHLR
jgi:hypothetical protein